MRHTEGVCLCCGFRLFGCIRSIIRMRVANGVFCFKLDTCGKPR